MSSVPAPRLTGKYLRLCVFRDCFSHPQCTKKPAMNRNVNTSSREARQSPASTFTVLDTMEGGETYLSDMPPPRAVTNNIEPPVEQALPETTAGLPSLVDLLSYLLGVTSGELLKRNEEVSILQHTVYDLEDTIDDQDETIENQEEAIDDHQQVIYDMEDIIIERDETIEGQQKIVCHLRKHKCQKQATIDHQQEDICQKQETIDRLWEHYRHQDETIRKLDKMYSGAPEQVMDNNNDEDEETTGIAYSYLESRAISPSDETVGPSAWCEDKTSEYPASPRLPCRVDSYLGMQGPASVPPETPQPGTQGLASVFETFHLASHPGEQYLGSLAGEQHLVSYLGKQHSASRSGEPHSAFRPDEQHLASSFGELHLASNFDQQLKLSPMIEEGLTSCLMYM